MIEKPLGYIHGKHLPRSTYQICQVERRVSGSTAHVEQSISGTKPGIAPGSSRLLRPYLVLKIETAKLLPVRSQDVLVLFVRTHLVDHASACKCLLFTG